MIEEDRGPPPWAPVCLPNTMQGLMALHGFRVETTRLGRVHSTQVTMAAVRCGMVVRLHFMQEFLHTHLEVPELVDISLATWEVAT